jgi:alpha-L-arabinofuranosidase
MRLIFDEWNGVWVWVSDTDENVELSPQFDEENYALQWQQRMKKIFTGK